MSSVANSASAAPPTTAPATTAVAPTTAQTTAPQTTPPTTEAPPPVVTQSVTAPTAPASTQILTSVITQSAETHATQPGQPQGTTVVVTQSLSNGNTAANGQTTALPTSTASGSNSNGGQHSSGLSSAGKTAIAVVIPILAVGALIFVAILLWRRRTRNRAAEEERRKEVEAYGYNPNDHGAGGTLPAIGVKDDEHLPEVVAASATGAGYGYRGWGGPATGGRAPSSTTAVGSSPPYPDGAMYAGAKSPTQGYHDGASDGYGHTRNGTMDSETIGVVGAAGAQAPLHRGPSNASSTYSTGQVSRHSAGENYPIPVVPGQQAHQQQDAYYPVAPPGGGDPYYAQQPGPYQAYNPHVQQQQQQQYGGGGQPVMRDGPGRTLGQIHEAGVQEPHDGISRNF